MVNYIRVGSPKIKEGQITFEFQISDNLRPYFKKTDFWYEIDGIECVPESISVIPLVCNLLPIVWLTNCTLYVETLDQSFYDSIEEIKKGYENMYPMLSFEGAVVCGSLQDNRYDSERSVVMFSGGVDAICTTIRHLNDFPFLLSIWGSADFPVSDKNGWEQQWKNLNYNSGVMGLNCHCVKSSFCEMFNLWHPGLQDLIDCSCETWWHGFQHGIGILSHSAPFAFIHHCSMAYIASSYHDSMRPFTCASDPTIDSCLKYGSTTCFHDAFELTRQEKVALIARYAKEHNRRFNIHVCLRQISQGDNCCKCEKCYRTILELLLEGADPHDFGFIGYDLDSIIHDMEHVMLIPITALPFYKDMQRKALGGVNSCCTQLVTWLRNTNFDDISQTREKRLRHLICRLKTKIVSIRKKLIKLR